MGKGSEGDAEASERLHGQSTEPAREFYRLTEEHDDASRTAQRRRAGSRFRYRRRRAAAHSVRTVDDAPFFEYVSAALRRTLALVCVQITLGTFTSGPDTGSDRTLARTAVVPMSYISSSIRYLHTSPHGSSADVLRSANFDLTTANTGFRQAYATLCYARPWPTLAHASLRPQRTCICPYIFTPSPLATRLSPPTAHQLQPAPPITCSRSLARPDRTDSSRLPVSLRPAVPPACRPNYPGRPAWTRPLPDRSAQRLHTGEPCHPVSHSTLHKYPRKNSEKKAPIHRSSSVFQEPGRGIRVSP
jgi:hypothetical protein